MYPKILVLILSTFYFSASIADVKNLTLNKISEKIASSIENFIIACIEKTIYL